MTIVSPSFRKEAVHFTVFFFFLRLKRSHYGLNSQNQKATSVSAGYRKTGQLPMLKLFADYSPPARHHIPSNHHTR